MALWVELPPKLAEIRQIIEQWVSVIDEFDTLPTTDQPSPNPDPLLDESAFNRAGFVNLAEITSALDSLETRFTSFYAYDTWAFESAAVRLFGGSLADLVKGGVADPAPARGAVFDLLARTDQEEMSQLDALLGLRPPQIDGEYAADEWTGDGAAAFYNGFVRPFHWAAMRHQSQAAVLAIVAQVYHRTSEAVQEDVLIIAASTLLRLKEIFGLAPTNSDLSVGEMISHLATVVSLLIPDPEDLLTIVSLTAGHQPSDDTVALPSRLGEAGGRQVDLAVTGGSAVAVINSAWEKLDELQQLIDDQDDHLRGELARAFDYSARDGFARDGLLVPRPDLADGSDTLGRVDVANPAANLEQVTATVAGIYQAGYEFLPSAANAYDAAAGLLESCRIDQPSAGFFVRSLPLFHGALDNLGWVCRDVRDSLSDAGFTLVEIATNYEFVDEQSATRFLELIADIPQPRESPPDPAPSQGSVFTPGKVGF